MSTVECKDCKSMISTSAEVWPHCGAKYPASYIPSKVILHRKPALPAMLAKMVISADGKKIGELKQDETITFDMLFGDHTLKAKADVLGGNSCQYSIMVLPARIYRIEVSFNFMGAVFESYVSET